MLPNESAPRLRDLAEGWYRLTRRSAVAAAMAPVDYWRYGAFARYVTASRRISGWTTVEEGVALMREASALSDEAVIVEVGSFLGRSAVLLGGARRLSGSGRVHCIDPFDGSGDDFSVAYYSRIASYSRRPLRARFEQHIAAAGLAPWIQVHQGTAEAISAIWSDPIDMLHLDGDQSPEGARAAFAGFAPFLKAGAVVAVHNSSDRPYAKGHDGQRRLVVEVLQAGGFTNLICVGSTTFATVTGGSGPGG